ncbi:MAG: hypothetical protein IID17_12210 [Nitrospinae bacterium]|nr:hypothetical protein [Nitrospinota bacterium]
MNENNKKRGASPDQMADWESLPQKEKQRQLKASKEVIGVMDQFMVSDPDFLRKEGVMIGYMKAKVFTSVPPEQWAALARSLYNGITARLN